jgi:hypothetical protein
MDGTQQGAEGTWQAAHAALVELARRRAGLNFDEGRLLLAARKAETHRQLGYGSFAEYVERLFGYAPRFTHEKLRVATALEALPELTRELREAGLTFSVVRELTRVVTPETERIWIESARGRTSRQVERLVSGRRHGALPDSPAEAALYRHVLRFEVSGETLATFREAVAQLRRDAGEHLDDDATLLLLARHVLGGPADDGRASYQVALDVCEDCQRARQQADGEPVVVSPTLVAMARCDAQWLPRQAKAATTHVGKTDTVETAHMDAARMETAHMAQAKPPTRPGPMGETAQVENCYSVAKTEAVEVTHFVKPESADAAAHATAPGPGVETEPIGENGSVDATDHVDHTHSIEEAGHAVARRSAARAAQGIPPAIRRGVLRRDYHRCQVPGCRHATFVDVHHVEVRADGGDHALSNLVTLCGAHHRAVHEGTLVITGQVGRLLVCHADGTPYGEMPVADLASVQAEAFRRLRGFGFGENAVRAALYLVIQRVRARAQGRTRGPRHVHAGIEVVLREALTLLTEGVWQEAS